jgi:protein O-GlcNAc transferase
MTKPTDRGRWQRALSLYQSGDIRGAAELYIRILKDRPRDFNALHRLGVIRFQEGKFEEAESLLSKSIKYNGTSADAHYFLGRVLWQKKCMERARFCFKKCIRIDPNYDNALISLGCIAAETANPQEAIKCFNQALAVNARNADGWFNCAMVLLGLGRFDAALEYLDKATAPSHRETPRLAAIVPGPCLASSVLAKGHYRLGMELYEQGRRELAVACLEQTLAIEPGYTEAKIGVCMAQLSVLYTDAAEIDACRAAYARCLTQLCEQIERDGTYRDFARAIGASQPFFLAYQGYCDRSLQAIYGSIVGRAMAEIYPAAALPAAPGPGERVRIGIVSGFFWDHSNWKIPIKGWLGQLDRNEFQIFGYYTGSKKDAATVVAATLCERSRANVRGSLAANDLGRRSPRPNLSRNRHGSRERSTGGAALGPRPVQFLGSPGNQRFSDDRLLP